MKADESVAEIIGDALCEIAPTLSAVDERARLIVARLREAGVIIPARFEKPHA